MPRRKESPPPTTPKPRAESAAETRAALIDAGMALFTEHGLDAPSLDAICARAGKTRGAFYVHFVDRDAFLEAVMEQAGASYLASVIGDAADLPTIVKRFIATVRKGDYPLTRPGGPRPHQLLDACARSPAVRARYVALIEQSLERLTTALDDGKPALVRDDLDPKVGARLIMATVLGAQTMIELGMTIDLARSAAQLMALFSPSKKSSRT